MKRFLFLVLLVIVGVGGVGFYLQWFQFGSATSDGKTEVTFTLDRNKIKADENKALEKVQDLGQSEKRPAPTGKTPSSEKE